MNTIHHIKKFVADAANNIFVWVIGPIYGWFCEFYTSGRFWLSPYVWLTLFWTGTYVIGSILAWISTEEKWEPKKSFQSVMRLLIGLLCLGAAAGLRSTNVTGAWLPSGILDTAMVFTEFAYFTKNLGRLSRLTGNKTQSDLLEFVSHAADEYLHTNVVTTHTTTTNTVTEPNEEPVVKTEVVEKTVTTTTTTEDTLKEGNQK